MASGCQQPPAPPTGPLSAEITLGYTHRGDEEVGEDGWWEAEHPEGELELDRWLLVISDVEVHACVPERTGWFNGFTLVPNAWAHVPSSATRLGTPFVEDLLAEDGRARILDEIAPPLMGYCALWVIVAPADDDVVNLTETTTEEVQGSTVVMSGRWRASSEEPWRTFAWSAIARGAYRVDAPIEVTASKASAFVLLDIERAATTFARIPLEELERGGDAVAQRIVDAMAEGFSLYDSKRKKT